MANTVTNRTISSSAKEAIQYLTLAYVDTADDSTIIYDSSAVAALVNLPDPLDSTIISICASASAASTARVSLAWDATTDVVAWDIPVNAGPTKFNFRCIGGLPNQGGAGKTGDIILRASGLGAGDIITVVLHVRRD